MFILRSLIDLPGLAQYVPARVVSDEERSAEHVTGLLKDTLIVP